MKEYRKGRSRTQSKDYYSPHSRTSPPSNRSRPSTKTSEQRREGAPTGLKRNDRRESSKENRYPIQHQRQQHPQHQQHRREERRHAPYNLHHQNPIDNQARHHYRQPTGNRPYNKPDHSYEESSYRQQQHKQQEQQRPHNPHLPVSDIRNYAQQQHGRNPSKRPKQSNTVMRQDAPTDRYASRYGPSSDRRGEGGGARYKNDDDPSPYHRGSGGGGDNHNEGRRFGHDERHCSGRHYDRHRNHRPPSHDHNDYPIDGGHQSRHGQYHHHPRNDNEQKHLSKRYEEETNNDGWETVHSNKNRSSRRRRDQQQQQQRHSSASATYTVNYNQSSQPILDETPFIPNFIPPEDTSSKNCTQFMLLLVGIPGSGKSTFAKALETAMPYKYVRINQDSLGSRQYCEEMTIKALREGKCPIIDRCNFDPQQRKHFLNIAAQQNTLVDAVVFTYPLDTCLKRCQARTNHETIKPNEALPILERMIQQFSPPLPNRVNAEKFRNLRNIMGTSEHNDVVSEYLNAM